MTIGKVGRGPLEGYTSGFDYVERNGKTVEVPRIANSMPLKTEYSKWLLVEVTLAVDRVDSSEWRLRAKDLQLRTSKAPSASSYECLGIVSPSYRQTENSWIELSQLNGVKDILRGDKEFSEAKWSGVRIVSTMYEEIGLPKMLAGGALSGDVIKAIKAILRFRPTRPVAAG
jgi:hypothetical protein